LFLYFKIYLPFISVRFLSCFLLFLIHICIRKKTFPCDYCALVVTVMHPAMEIVQCPKAVLNPDICFLMNSRLVESRKCFL
jgi:hypothetical protein